MMLLWFEISRRSESDIRAFFDFLTLMLFLLSLSPSCTLPIQVIRVLGLEDVADMIIGSPESMGGVSAEYRKKTSIAVELVTAPKILFLDEPTYVTVNSKTRKEEKEGDVAYVSLSVRPSFSIDFCSSPLCALLPFVVVCLICAFSTGLDAPGALGVIKTLRRLADSIVVICTIHQVTLST